MVYLHGKQCEYICEHSYIIYTLFSSLKTASSE